MTISYTETQTYTVADVKNVFEQVVADLSMIVRTTGLWTPQFLEETIDDVFAFTEAGYISRVDIVLGPAGGGLPLKANRYDVSEDASSWENAAPRGNVWPRVAGATLHIFLTWSTTWRALSAVQQQNFRNDLRHSWAPSAINLGYPGLSAGEPVRYASRAFGVERRTYERVS